MHFANVLCNLVMYDIVFSRVIIVCQVSRRAILTLSLTNSSQLAKVSRGIRFVAK